MINPQDVSDIESWCKLGYKGQLPNAMITGLEGGPTFFNEVLNLAASIKADPISFYEGQPLKHRVITGLFMNPSLRTRSSLESAIARLGGHFIHIPAGQGSWKLEFNDHAVMNDDAAEHIKEAAGVLSSYSDLIGLRAFAQLKNFKSDMEDRFIRQLARYSNVPLLSLESAVYHPTQAFADALTMREELDKTQGKRFTLAWTTHPKMCGVAVPHSALMVAAQLGMNIQVAHPPGYELDQDVTQLAGKVARTQGGSLHFTHSLNEACKDANIIYAKAWGAPQDYGDTARGIARNARYSKWTIGLEHLLHNERARFMHCLPVRREVVVRSNVLDSSASLVQVQAANRQWVMMALLLKLLKIY